MTSMERELGQSISVIDVAAVFENLVRRRIDDLHVDLAPA